MAVYRRGYHRYKGPVLGRWARFMVMPRFAWRRLFQQRLVLLLLVIAMIWPVLCACFIYLANHADLLKGMFEKEFSDFIQANGQFFLVFMDVQSALATFLAALIGPGLIAPDLANNALPLYFSRPITRSDYAIARLLVLFGMLSLITWVPGLLLFCVQAAMAGGGWMRANWSLGMGLFAGFAIYGLLVSMVSLASSAYVKWRFVAGGLVLGFFFILAGISVMINEVFRVTWGHVLNPAWAAYRIWCALLGVEPPGGPSVFACASALVVAILMLAWVLERRLRPVEVIS
jgi:ABC-2 type transport system permease protein